MSAYWMLGVATGIATFKLKLETRKLRHRKKLLAWSLPAGTKRS